MYSGLAWLFLGVANTDALLYDDDWARLREENPQRFRVDYALSREQVVCFLGPNPTSVTPS